MDDMMASAIIYVSEVLFKAIILAITIALNQIEAKMDDLSLKNLSFRNYYWFNTKKT